MEDLSQPSTEKQKCDTKFTNVFATVLAAHLSFITFVAFSTSIKLPTVTHGKYQKSNGVKENVTFFRYSSNHLFTYSLSISNVLQPLAKK